MAIFQIAKNGIDLFDFTSFFLAWTFSNLLAHTVKLFTLKIDFLLFFPHRFCCDPQDDINCAYVMECCKVYIDLKRNLHRQYGIEKSGQNTNNTKHHLFVIVGKKQDKHMKYF